MIFYSKKNKMDGYKVLTFLILKVIIINNNYFFILYMDSQSFGVKA